MAGDGNSYDVVVIGAGISGLLCAHRLHSQGVSVVVLEKSRGVGGRMATRRLFGGRADHGAQYFTCRNPRFQGLIDGWLDEGVVREWFRHLPEDSNPAGYPRYCGAEGMTSVPKTLALDLEVHCGQQVIQLDRAGAHWTVTTKSGDCFLCRELIITAPLPQAATLLHDSSMDPEIVPGAIRYEKGIAAMVLLDGASGLPDFGGLKPGSKVLSWIADNRMKGISGDTTIVTLHSSAEFADQYWDEPDEVRGRIMIDELKEYICAKPLDFVCHRWRYTTPLNPCPERCRREESVQLTLAGDAFGGPRIEGAALSGLAAADALLSF
jgi:predicted NAD/FAD-dependent oxidoreductase